MTFILWVLSILLTYFIGQRTVESLWQLKSQKIKGFFPNIVQFGKNFAAWEKYPKA